MIPHDPEVIEYTGFRDMEPDGVLEQPFWERYNSRLELPISFSLAILIPVAAVALVIFFSFLLPDSRNNAPVAITALDGEDDKGVGSAGTGGVDEPIAFGAAPRQADLDRLPKEADLNKVREEMQQAIRVDGSTDVEISDTTAAALGTLHDDIRRKISGQKKGSGGSGTGGHEGTGTGPGGTGADSTRARALRWVIKFDTRSGQDYVRQIGGLGGRILLQVKDDNSRMYIYKDLRNSFAGKIATEADFAEIGDWLQFEDIRRNSVEAVAEALGLNYVPPVFFAKFPKAFEEKLDRLERQYLNKNPKEIRETTFKVIIRGGDFDLQVTNQILK